MIVFRMFMIIRNESILLRRFEFGDSESFKYLILRE